jgi:hypothetical protein
MNSEEDVSEFLVQFVQVDLEAFVILRFFRSPRDIGTFCENKEMKQFEST